MPPSPQIATAPAPLPEIPKHNLKSAWQQAILACGPMQRDDTVPAIFLLDNITDVTARGRLAKAFHKLDLVPEFRFNSTDKCGMFYFTGCELVKTVEDLAKTIIRELDWEQTGEKIARRYVSIDSYTDNAQTAIRNAVTTVGINFTELPLLVRGDTCLIINPNMTAKLDEILSAPTIHASAVIKENPVPAQSRWFVRRLLRKAFG